MKTRHPHWQEIPGYSKIFNFKWKPFSTGIRFDELSLYGNKQMVNHILHHEEITMKDSTTSASFRKGETMTELGENLLQIYQDHSYNFEVDSAYKNMELPATHLGSSNCWFLKVTKLNRGRGIYVFDTVDQLISLINECTESSEGTTLVKESDINRTNTLKDRK